MFCYCHHRSRRLYHFYRCDQHHHYMHVIIITILITIIVFKHFQTSSQSSISLPPSLYSDRAEHRTESGKWQAGKVCSYICYFLWSITRVCSPYLVVLLRKRKLTVLSKKSKKNYLKSASCWLPTRSLERRMRGYQLGEQSKISR